MPSEPDRIASWRGHRAPASAASYDPSAFGSVPRRVLVIEDHPNIANLIKLHVQEVASEVKLAFDGYTGLGDAQSGRYDLVILDLMLPGIGGLEICRRMRCRGDYTPILMLTAKSAATERVIGLETGADDYLIKPFSVAELVARVKALFRRLDGFGMRPSTQAPSIYKHADLSIDQANRQVMLRGKRIDLTVKEFDLLMLLAANPGKTFTRAQLLDQVWSHNYTGCETTVKSHVNRLRDRIEDDPANPKYVFTVWGVGYRFADLEPVGS